MRPHRSRWRQSTERAALLSLYAEVDALLADRTCACSSAGVGQAPDARCCYFGVTGREPYPTAVELEEVAHALRANNVTPRAPRKLPLADVRAYRPCPLLSDDGRCRIYASRPFGCRTFFCDQKLPRADLNAMGRLIADLSARFAPRDPGPRPLVRALADRPR